MVTLTKLIRHQWFTKDLIHIMSTQRPTVVSCVAVCQQCSKTTVISLKNDQVMSHHVYTKTHRPTVVSCVAVCRRCCVACRRWCRCVCVEWAPLRRGDSAARPPSQSDRLARRLTSRGSDGQSHGLTSPTTPEWTPMHHKYTHMQQHRYTGDSMPTTPCLKNDLGQF